MNSDSSLYTDGARTSSFICAERHARYHIYFVLDSKTENRRADTTDVSAMTFIQQKLRTMATQLNAGVDAETLLRPSEIIHDCFHKGLSDEFRQQHPHSHSVCAYTGVVLDRQELQLYVVNLGDVRCMLYETKKFTLRAHDLVTTKPHSTQERIERKICQANGLTIQKHPNKIHTLYGSKITRIFGDTSNDELLLHARQVLGTSPDIDVFDLSSRRKSMAGEVHCLIANSALFEQLSTESILRARMLRTATPQQLANILAQVVNVPDLTIVKVGISFIAGGC